MLFIDVKVNLIHFFRLEVNLSVNYFLYCFFFQKIAIFIHLKKAISIKIAKIVLIYFFLNVKKKMAYSGKKKLFIRYS